ncbi:M56 family metallopeptidase [Lactobacillus sp. DCY120]|uniref:M56 family metallopeptidase n=1 Tax=Bombilactobacillus apium TaxID=2675299 RepID=A0A850R7S7_9LACO|nr:M56 family metallopeptidase [Bombilactobacillus apium]NVY96585.1 M56 family metallopeptidase [Bombilactobacillus apium]
MHLSLSSILISILFATLLIVIFEFILDKTSLYKVFRVDFLLSFCVLLVVRLCLPVELINTKTIKAPHFLSVLYEFLHQDLLTYHGLYIDPWLIIIVVWTIGVAIKVSLLIYHQTHSSRIIEQLLEPVKFESSNKHSKFRHHTIPIYYLDFSGSPFVVGLLKPKIIIPKQLENSKYLDFILSHEVQHIRNHDLWSKAVVELVICLYWWFPPIYRFRTQFALVLEMYVDSQVERKIDRNDSDLVYAESLVEISKSISGGSKKKDSLLSLQFTIAEEHTLSRRIKFMFEDHRFKHTHLVSIIVIPLLLFLVTSIVVEPDISNAPNTKGTYRVYPKGNSKDYLLKKGKKYYLVIDGHIVGTVDNIKDPSVNKLKIREEKLSGK